jgi:transaldolase
MYDNYGFTTKILAASIRHSAHVRESALIGADVATMPLNVVKSLYKHPLTDKGIEIFLNDHKKANSK